MTFLKKLGESLTKGIVVASGLWPLVSGFFGSNTKTQQAGAAAVNDLTSVAQVVVQTETIMQGSGNGALKLQAATPLVANIVRTSELVSGKKIANDTLFVQGCSKVTSGVADILNSLHPDAVQVSGTALPAPTPQS